MTAVLILTHTAVLGLGMFLGRWLTIRYGVAAAQAILEPEPREDER